MNRTKYCIKNALGEIIAINSKRSSAQKLADDKFGKDLYKVYPSSEYKETLENYLKRVAKA